MVWKRNRCNILPMSRISAVCQPSHYGANVTDRQINTQIRSFLRFYRRFFSVILEYNLYPFIIRTLGGLSDFEVTNCQPFLLLHSALICFLGISSMLQNVLKFAVLSLTSAIITESI